MEPGQVGVFHALARMMNEHLGLEAPILGWLPKSTRFGEANRDGSIGVLRASHAQSDEARALRTIADVVLDAPCAPLDEWLRSTSPGPEDEEQPTGPGVAHKRTGPVPPSLRDRPTVPIGVAASSPPPVPRPVAVPIKPRVYKRPPYKPPTKPEPGPTTRTDIEHPSALPGMPPQRSSG
jgi:hypothetical protein